MKHVITESRCAGFNLAAEEYFLSSKESGDVFLLYENDTCTVSGKYQNIFEEVDLSFTEPNTIPSFRRLSGGGTVFHGRGNVNFSFITDCSGSGGTDYEKSAELIISSLARLGIKAFSSSGSDLMMMKDSRPVKISGNAQCIKNGRMICHGTLLYSADRSLMHKVLDVPEGRYTSKAIKSNRAVTANITEISGYSKTTEDFKNDLLSSLGTALSESRCLTESEKEDILALHSSKYGTDEWNILSSPPSVLENTVGNDNILININKGIITDISCRTDGFPDPSVIKGKRFGYNSLVSSLHEENLPEDVCNRITALVFGKQLRNS